MRRTRRSDIDGLFALLAAGCGSSEPITGDTNAAPRSLAVGDLRPLVTISPGATGWPWPVNPQTRVASPPFELDESDPSYPIQKALSDVYQDAGLVKSATSSWFDGTKKASSFANLVATPAEATSAEAEREFARAWFPEFEHTKRFATSERRASVSVAVRGGTDNAGFVEIGWRTANAVLSVYVTCNPCDSDIADAARRWADKIDDAAQGRPLIGPVLPPYAQRLSPRASVQGFPQIAVGHAGEPATFGQTPMPRVSRSRARSYRTQTRTKK